MSVKATTRRGKPVWVIQVIRDGRTFNRRRFLDRRTYLKQDALAVEAELIAEYERTTTPQGGDDHHQQHRSGAAGTPTTTTPRTRRTPTTTPPSSPSPTTPAARTPSPSSAQPSPPSSGPTRSTRSPTPRRSPRVTSPAHAAGSSRTPTLADFAERYLALQDPRRSDYDNKTRTLRLHLLPHLGHLRLDQISSMVIDELRARLRSPDGEPARSRRSLTRKEVPTSVRRKGGPKSPKTINNILTILRSMLKLAHDYELLDRVPRFRMEKVLRPDPSFLEEAEVLRLVAATPEEWRLVVFTAARTGLRRGELMGLRWEDVHLEERRPFLRVHRSVRCEPNGALRVKEPKSGKPRSVPLTGDLAEALATARPERPERGALVFPGPCEGYLDHNQLWKVVSSSAQAAGLDKHVHPHLLRHTFASECYRRGIPPQVVQLWLGHAHITTTERYAHLAPTAGEDLIDRLGGRPESRGAISQLFGGAPGARGEADLRMIRGNTTGNTTDRRDAKNAVQGGLDGVR